MHDMLPTSEVARVLETSERMVHYYVRHGRLTPKHRIGRLLLFDPVEVATLKPKLVRRNWSRQLQASSGASLGILGAGIAVPEGGGVAGWVGLAAAGGLVLWGLHGLVKQLTSKPAEQPVDAIASVGMPWVEWAALEIAEASVHVCPHRGRVYSALGGEFWRSSLDGSWLFARGSRLETVDPSLTVVWRALNRRDGRERLSVVA